MQEGNTNPGIPGHSPGTQQQWERHQSDAQGHMGDQEFSPDLSAFLSQDELNKSVDLAREAIGCPSAGDGHSSTSRPNAACQAMLGPRESSQRQDLQNMDRVLQQNQAQAPERTLNSCQPAQSDDESPNRTQQNQSGSIDTSCSAYRPSAIRGGEVAGFGQQKQGAGKSVGSETDSKHNAAALIEELSSLFKSGPPRRGGRNRGRRAGRGGHVSTEDICQAMDCPKQGPTAPAPVERIRVQSKEQLFQMRQQQQQQQQQALQQQQEVLPQQQEDQNSLCDYIQQQQQQQQDVRKPTELTSCQEDLDAEQDSNHNDHHHHHHQHQEASAQREFPNQQQLENSVEVAAAAAASAQQQQQRAAPPAQAVETRSVDPATSLLAREPPRFTTKLKSREVPEGSRVQLDCRLSGAPAPSVRWFCEGKELENSPDIQILQNADLQTLIISEAFQEDTGRYTCLASNVDGTDSTSAEIYIEGATSSDSEGEASAASLEDDLAQAQKLMSVSLTIAAPPQNSGMAQVEMQAQPPLVQPIAAPVIPQKVASPSFGLPGFDGQSGVMAAPVFTKPLTDATASEGQLVVLECRVKGSPAPKITWYREDAAVDDSPDFRLLQKKPRSVAEPEEICTLIISEAFPEDSGTFTCMASSKLGTVSCSAQLIVHGATDGYMSSNTCGPSLVVESTHLSTSESMYMDTLPPPILDSFISDISADKPNSTVQLPAATESLFANGRMPDFIVPGKKSVRAAAATSSFASSAEAALAELRKSIDDVVSPPPSMTMSVPMPAAAAAPAGDAVGPEGKTNAKAGLRVHFRLPGEAPPEGFGGELPRPGQGLPSPVKEPPPLPAKPKLDPLQLQQLHNQVLLEQQEAFLLSHHQQLPFPPPPAAFLQSPTTPSQPPVAETAVPPPPPPPPPPAPPAPPATTTASMSLANSAALPLNQQPSRASVGQQSFSYARPKQFIAAQNLTSTIISAGSPSSSPVPTSLGLSLPAPPPPQTAPPANNTYRMASPTLSSPTFLNNSNAKTAAAYSPPIAMSPPPQFSAASPTPPATYPGSPHAQPGHTWSSLPQSPQSPPTVSPPASFVQSPAAFLSALLPSLPSLPPTNAMGLPRAAPSTQMQGSLKRQSRGPRSVSEDDIRDTKDALIQDLEKKLRFKEDILHNGQSRLTYEEKMARRLLGPNSTAVVFQADEPEEHDAEAQDFKSVIQAARESLGKQQEYKVSSFEQRLMSEIEFRLERTPVEESDDEVEHDDIPTGRCIAPIFERKLKHFKTFEGSPITFSCKVSGTPTPKIYWFKDGNQISKKSERFQMQRDSEGNCSLHIPLTTMDDDGNYTVMAGNPQFNGNVYNSRFGRSRVGTPTSAKTPGYRGRGRISCSGRLMVQNVNQRGRVARSQSGQPAARSRPRSQSRESRDDSDMVQEKNFRPHFLQAPGDTMAHEGKLCRLDCKVSGLPTPELEWQVNGRPVRPDATHKMLVRENGVHSLVIEPLTVQDGGLYTCTATNRAGQNSFSLNLTIVAKQLTRAPVILEKLQNTGVAEGQPVRLECRVHSMPPPTIFWKKENETLIPHRERTSMHQDPSGYVCLIIQPTKKEDAGWYTVSAKNSVGISSCTARLDIYAEWHHEIPKTRRVRPSSSRYAALTDQGLDVRSAFLPDPSHAGAQGNLVESDEL